MIEEADLIWTLMVSYFMQKYTYDDITTSNDGGGISDARNLAQLSLILAFWYDRESLFDLEATATSLRHSEGSGHEG